MAAVSTWTAVMAVVAPHLEHVSTSAPNGIGAGPGAG